MELSYEQKKGREILFNLIKKAWNDETFKQNLLNYPNETLESFFGKKLPEEKKIRVTDQSNPEYLYINIPVNPVDLNFELEDRELENISGGDTDLYRFITSFNV